MSQQAKRNKILNNLDGEWEVYLSPELALAQHSYLHFSTPKGKDSKEDKASGKRLAKLIQLWKQLKVLQVQKQMLDELKKLSKHRHNQKDLDKLAKDWAKLHEKHLAVGSKYLKEKENFQKNVNYVLIHSNKKFLKPLGFRTISFLTGRSKLT